MTGIVPMSCLKLVAAVVLSLGGTGAALADCDLNLRVHNIADGLVGVRVASAQVRSGVASVAWGPWRDASRGGWFAQRGPQDRVLVAPGDYRGEPYRASLGCDARRQFRVQYRCHAGPRAGSLYWATTTTPADSLARHSIVTIDVGDRC